MRSVNNMAAWGHIITDDGAWQDHVVNGTIPDLVGVSEHVPPALKRVLRTACAPDRAPTLSKPQWRSDRRSNGSPLYDDGRGSLWTSGGCEHGGRDEAVRYLGGA